MINKTLYILSFLMLVGHQCKVVKDTPEVSEPSFMIRLDSSSLVEKTDIILIDTLTIEGYLLDLARIKFGNHNSGSVIIDSLLFDRICYNNPEIDFYEYLLGESILPILEIGSDEFPTIKWNLLNPNKQTTHGMIANIPDSIFFSEIFQKDTYLGTYEYKGEYLEFREKPYVVMGAYKGNASKVKISGFVMEVNRNIGLPFWSTTLESMVFDKYGSLTVFVPMELYERVKLDKRFYSDFFRCN